jgi:reactive intermediate/imine deaminase
MARTTYPLAHESLSSSGPSAGKVAFSNAVKIEGGPLLFVSGQLAYNDKRELVGKGDIRAQTRQVLENIKKALAAAGSDFSRVVKVTVFIKDMAHFRDIHDVRLQYFQADALPASTMVAVSGFVHPDALIEIEAVAALKP